MVISLHEPHLWAMQGCKLCSGPFHMLTITMGAFSRSFPANWITHWHFVGTTSPRRCGRQGLDCVDALGVCHSGGSQEELRGADPRHWGCLCSLQITVSGAEAETFPISFPGAAEVALPLPGPAQAPPEPLSQPQPRPPPRLQRQEFKTQVCIPHRRASGKGTPCLTVTSLARRASRSVAGLSRAALLA